MATTVNHVSQIGGTGDQYALALKVFSGEVLTAFARSSVTKGRFSEKTVGAGKSWQFPAFGRMSAKYLTPGNSLDDQRQATKQGERTVTPDGLLTTDVLVTDFEMKVSHFGSQALSDYSRQMGEALALSYDKSVLAEIAKEALNVTPNVDGLGTGGVVARTLAVGQTVGINEATAKAIYDIALEVKAKMAKNYVPVNDRYCFLEPELFSALASSTTFLNRDFGANGTILEGNVVRLAGFDFIECPHLTAGGDDNANVTMGTGHVFPAAYAAKKPMLFCHRDSVGIVLLDGIKMEKARRIEYQADQIVGKLMMGSAGLRPECTFMGVVNPPA